jgi:hypothetical protein
VSPLRAAAERFDASRHDTSQFQSGNQALDRWLVRYAGQSERRDAARTFVITDAGVVIGYYAPEMGGAALSGRPSAPHTRCVVLCGVVRGFQVLLESW